MKNRVFCAVNDRLCEMTGYAREELVDRSERILHASEESYEYFGRDTFALMREHGEATVETKWVHKSGKEIWVFVCAAPANAEDLSQGVFVAAMDITERRRVETLKRRAEKLTAIAQLAGGVAHYFNNQLAGIMGYADLIHEAVEHDPALERYSGAIIATCERASQLTNQLLAFARRGKYRSVAIDLNGCVESAVAELAAGASPGIALECRLHPESVFVMGDPTLLRTAVVNLGLNARDAVGGGGRITLSTNVVVVDECHAAGVSAGLAPGTYIEVTVSDTGCGIPAEAVEHIFEPFFTTKERGRGIGMGLAAVYGIVKSHHGSVHVCPNQGGGTAFALLLPKADLPGGGVEPRSSSPGDGRSRQAGHVLLVDDEEMVRTMASDVLESLGYTVTTCRDGAEALAYYQEFWSRVDLVILDMIMPNMDGRETFVEMKRINPAVRALLSSGYSMDGEARGLLEEGVAGFVQKPYRKHELGAAIGSLIE